MNLTLKTKLGLGLSFLFIVIVSFGIVALFAINRLNNDSQEVLKNNFESLVWTNNMLKSLEEIPADPNALGAFDANLQKQENNITEYGEREATQELRADFTLIKKNLADPGIQSRMRQSIQTINALNQQAIVNKNSIARKTAADATFWLTALIVVLSLITLTFVVNFPAIISTPIRVLNEGIREIANKNYRKRIFLHRTDEFGELAEAFNSMAEKLDEYEHSNLAQLRFEKSRIETIINQMKDGIIGLDAKRNVLFLNAVAEQLLGLKQQEVVGRYVADIAVKHDLMRSLLRQENNKELKIYADNKESYFNKDFLNVSHEGKTIGEVIVLRNVTPFHELNEAKTNFIATVSHELKTPISSIKLSTRLLSDTRVGELNQEQTELIGNIEDDTERLLKITGELLNIAQVETGHMQVNPVLLHPAGLIDNAVSAVAAKAREKSIVIKDVSAPGLPQVEADAEKTTWVLNNLLTNAIKYSYPGSTIEVSAGIEQDEAIFVVRDFGPGIDKKYLPRLFERYFRIPGDTEKGTGIGLTISRAFIEAQMGKIWITSTVGQGTTAYFSLPLRSKIT